MKKIFILTVLLLPAALFAKAQVAGGRIAIDNLDVRLTGDSVRVDYTAAIARKAVERDHTLIMAPVIVGGEYRQSLPALVVHGRGSKIARRRREIAFGTSPAYEKARVGANGGTVAMSASVPFQEWMYGAKIIFESVVAGCCYSTEFEDAVAAESVLPAPPVPVAAVTPEPQWVPASVADSLSTAFPFVVPMSQFDPDEPFKIYDDELSNGLEIYFPVAKYDIDPGYLENDHTLNNLIGCINLIAASSDSNVERIIVAGFASPEGNFEFNDRLAFERAVSLKRYIMDNTAVADNMVSLFNGSVDWRGLRARIERSTLPEKKELLSLIDNTPLRDAAGRPLRLEELRRMNGGRTYRYLEAEHFPYLRSGAFIKVFYENK